jgi:glycosyltransferase involved in cell wall biosynthesis
LAKLSVLLPVYNEEKKIVECLESIKWTDEILVVDSYSNDRTVEITRKYGARVIQHEYINSAKQKNWAIPQCAYEWVLQIDADERLDDILQEEIKKIIQESPPDFDGYRINFKHHVLGKWMQSCGLYPEYHLRLFRRDAGRFADREVDAHVIVKGKVGTLSGHILHYGVDNLSQRLQPLDRYTKYEADEREKVGRKFSWFNLIIKPPLTFLYYFFYKGGFTEGYRGLIISYLKMDFIFWTYAKLWEKDFLAGKRK